MVPAERMVLRHAVRELGKQGKDYTEIGERLKASTSRVEQEQAQVYLEAAEAIFTTVAWIRHLITCRAWYTEDDLDDMAEGELSRPVVIEEIE
jgi:hypothetical protein